MHAIGGEIRELQGMDEQELRARARAIEAPYEVLAETAKRGRLPVVNFSAGGIATPCDAALMMQMGADGVFVGSGIFKSTNPEKMAKAIVEAVHHYTEREGISRVSRHVGTCR